MRPRDRYGYGRYGYGRYGYDFCGCVLSSHAVTCFVCEKG